jgi:hypothetical protein
MSNPWARIVEDAPPGATTEPLPSGSDPDRRSLDLPIPDPPVLAPPPSGAGFSAETLVEHIERPAGPDPEPDGWSELRGVLVAAILGGLAIALAVAWSQRSAEPPPPSPAPPTGAPPTAAGPAPTTAPPTRVRRSAPDAKPVEAAPVRAAAVPMLSVVSTPPGAWVEIDGVIYGQTPLILPSPRAFSLRVKLRLDEHRPVDRVLEPGPAGHFNLNVQLDPR